MCECSNPDCPFREGCRALADRVQAIESVLDEMMPNRRSEALRRAEERRSRLMATRDISDAEVVRACRDIRAAEEVVMDALELLMARTGRSPKECWRALERTYDRGLIDFGVGLHRAFPTEAGEALLSQEPVQEAT